MNTVKISGRAFSINNVFERNEHLIQTHITFYVFSISWLIFLERKMLTPQKT
jgi:hypothetical protein